MIAFDLWKTLLYSDPLYKSSRASFISSHSKNHLNFDATISDLKTFEKQFDSLTEKFHIQIHEDVVLELLIREFNLFLNLQELKTYLHELLMNHPPRLYDGVEELCNTLARKHQLIIVSNTVLIPGRQLRKYIPSSFKECYFSNETMVPKPSKFIVPEKLHGKIKLHVGDNPHTDGLFASNIGALYCHINDGTELVNKIKNLNADGILRL